MSQRYSVTPHPVETLLTWVKSGEIAIPEIQRPFVWEAAKVRNLLDSLYAGYPIGYLIAWRNPTIKLKDGTSSAGKRILIDGQQRVTALMAGLLGHHVLTKDYKTVRIKIAFHPVDERFEVSNPAILKDVTWIPDIAELFAPDASLLKASNKYAQANPQIEPEAVHAALERLRNIVHNNVGVIELAEDLDIEEVTEIFIRVNSAGAELSQADFAMSKIASNDKFGGNVLRKAIDYFCHLAVAPEFIGQIEAVDHAFATSEFLPKMRWLKDASDDIYDPTYTDMLRVAFTSEFRRGRLADLVALLSGRNFETKQYEEVIAEDSFAKLRAGIHSFINQTHFERFTMILRGAGFVTRDLVGSRNAVDFAYIIYLRGRAEHLDSGDLERLVKRWYVMSTLRGRYAGSPETAFDLDIRQIEANGLQAYADTVISTELAASFWDDLLPQLMDTSSSISPYFTAFKAAQAKLGDTGFLSRDIKALDLLLNRTDVHHIYPANHLKSKALPRGQYNQIANFALTQSEINIAIGDKAPATYFRELALQCAGGPKKYGSIIDLDEMEANLRINCIPEAFLHGEIPEYPDFLRARRKLMAAKLRTWYLSL
jgi:Protein of unknown function DUF262